MVPALTIIKGKVLLRSRILSDLDLRILGRIILAVTAALEALAIKVPQAARDRGDSPRILWGMSSRLLLARI